MPNNERIYKQSVITLTVSATTTPTLRTNVTFWSHDIDTAMQVIELKKDSAPLSLEQVEEITLVLQFAGRQGVIHLTPEIEDAAQGMISIVLPMGALGFDGEVTGGLFLRFQNQQSLDCGYFVFNLRTSSIDDEVGDLADFYVQRFEELEQWVRKKAEDIVADLDDLAQITSHMSDDVIHVTADDRERWEAGQGVTEGNDIPWGTDNIRIGLNATLGEQATNAIAVGFNAKANSTSCIAVGRNAKAILTHSVAVGVNALADGASSTAVGYNAKANGASSTALGHNAQVTTANTMRLGGINLAALESQVALSVTADARDKTDITPIETGLEFLTKLTPIQYVDNDRHKYLPEREEMSEDAQAAMDKYGLPTCYDHDAYQEGTKKGERKRVGLSAQEIQQALVDTYGSVEFANIVNDNFFDLEEQPTEAESQLSVAYQNLIPFLIKAVQELHTRIETLEEKV